MSPRVWQRAAARSRIWLACREAGAKGLWRKEMVAMFPDIGERNLETALLQLKHQGWLEHEGRGGKYRLADGARVPPIVGEAQPPAGHDAAEPLALRAFEAVAGAQDGLDSAQLAQQLGAGAAEVDAALQAEVDETRRLVRCTVIRDGARLTLYRRSAGGRKPQVPALDAPAELVLPVVEVDIDAVRRGRQAAPQGAAQADDDYELLVALDSDGVLRLQFSARSEVRLRPAQTRVLFRYLDRLAGTLLEEALP